MLQFSEGNSLVLIEFMLQDFSFCRNLKSFPSLRKIRYLLLPSATLSEWDFDKDNNIFEINIVITSKPTKSILKTRPQK